MRAIVVEDELIARRCICTLAENCGIEVLAECRNGEEAIQSLQRYRADLLFLDVEMPGTDGFGVLRVVPAENIPAIIFTTAYDHYAVRAFEHHAVDYLLKPFDEVRFRKAVDRVQMLLHINSNRGDIIRDLLSEINRTRQLAAPERLVVRSRREMKFLRVEDFDWIEASHNHVKIHIGRDVHSIRQTIADVEARLQPDKFLRIHRSLIVNVDRILRLEACGYGEYLVVLQDGKKLSLSRGYRDRLDRLIGICLMAEESLKQRNHRESIQPVL
jgi:two-component system LytT family response regulator